MAVSTHLHNSASDVGQSAQRGNTSPYRYGRDIRKLTLREVLKDAAERQGDKTYVNFLTERRTLSYRDADLASNRLANGLKDAGVGKGEHVAIMMENCPEMLLALFAVTKIGAVAVPLNVSARASQLQYLIGFSDCIAVIVDAPFVERVAEVLPQLPDIRFLVVHGDKPDIATTKPMLALSALLESSAVNLTVDSSFDDRSMLAFTSGTTGPSKACMLTQARTFLWGMSHAQTYGHRSDDVFYVCLPLFHVNALLGNAYNALGLGATVALQRRFSATSFWQDIRESGATIANMLGSMAAILWSKPPSPDDKNHRVRLSQAGPTPSMAKEFQQRFNLKLVLSYGMTDYGTTHTFDGSNPDKLGSSGRLREGVQARITDEDDFDVPPGAQGQILVRNDNLWEAGEGYYKMPQATVDAFRNGWFHTGDIGRVDADGYLWFVGRDKEVIRRRGENISSVEVETILLTHPQIVDASVYPVNAALGEEEVAVAIIRQEDSKLTETDIVRFCADKMAYYMVPKYVQLVDDLPRNLALKVEKYKLRAQAEQDMGALWDRDKAGVVISR